MKPATSPGYTWTVRRALLSCAGREALVPGAERPPYPLHSVASDGATLCAIDVASVPIPASGDAGAALRFRDPDLTPTPRGPEGEVGITPAPLRTS
jgi:hypothetical protein